MANFVYDKAATALWGADIAFDTDNIKAVLVDTASYTVDKVNDQFLSAIVGGARTAVSANLTTKTIIGRIIDADDVVYSAVAGAVSEAIVIYQDTGAEATSRLLIYADTAGGLPATPNGTDITIVWNALGIATL